MAIISRSISYRFGLNNVIYLVYNNRVLPVLNYFFHLYKLRYKIMMLYKLVMENFNCLINLLKFLFACTRENFQI